MSPYGQQPAQQPKPNCCSILGAFLQVFTPFWYSFLLLQLAFPFPTAVRAVLLRGVSAFPREYCPKTGISSTQERCLIYRTSCNWSWKSDQGSRRGTRAYNLTATVLFTLWRALQLEGKEFFITPSPLELTSIFDYERLLSRVKVSRFHWYHISPYNPYTLGIGSIQVGERHRTTYYSTNWLETHGVASRGQIRTQKTNKRNANNT